MGAALLPLAIGGAGIAGGQYMKRQEADAQKAALPQLLHQASLASRPQTLALQAFGPTRADMAQTAMRAGQPEMALKLSGLDRILGLGQPQKIVNMADPKGNIVAVPENMAAQYASRGFALADNVKQQTPDKPNLPAGMELVNGQARPIPGYLTAAAQAAAATRQPESAMSGMTELDKLIAKRDALPMGSPNRKIYEDAIAKATQTRDEGEGRDFTESKGLRSEFTTQAKPFQEVIRAYSRISSAGKGDPNGASDIALVYGYMKMLDPTSVVREGEFATAANAGGIPERVQNLYNAAISGQKLPPEVRSQFLDISTRLYDDADSQLSQLENTYTDLAKRNNLRPENVVIDLRGGVKRTQPKAPTPNLSDMSNEQLMKALLGQQ